MLAHFINVQYCYQYLVAQIPMGLLLYAHLPVALTALIFSIYVFVKSRNLPSFLLLCTCFTFTVWVSFDLSAWFAFFGSSNTMFVWSLLDFMAVLMFFFAYYFTYTFITGRDLPVWQKIIGILAILPTAYISFKGLNIPMYDFNSCAALEDGAFTIYTYYTEAFFILATLVFIIVQYVRNKERLEKSRILLSGIGILTFLSVFFSASFLVSLLAATDASLYVYNYLIYGLFGMPIFLIYLGYLIVRYRAFNLRAFAAQALVLGLVALIGAEFFFTKTISTFILTGVTFVGVVVFGRFLIRSVRKEVEQKEELVKLNVDLENLIKQRESLVHLVTHKVKGSFTRSKYIFAGLLDGTFGEITPEVKKFAEQGLESDNMGIETVDLVLNAANMQKGTVKYDMKKTDFKEVLLKVLAEKKIAIEKKGLQLEQEIIDGDYNTIGDVFWLKEAVNNLIENSLKYTRQGKILVKLEKRNTKILLSIKDTGVGITDEDKKNLFTEGGRGKESVKINVDSTGYGLYTVRLVIEAHKGRVWGESEGPDKGSTFFVELDAI